MVQIIVFTLISAVIIVYLRSINSELSMLASIVAGIILIFFSLKYLSDTLYFVHKLIELTGIDEEMYLIIFKITAIGYIVEFGAQTVNDFGLKSLADKLILAGKIIILTVALPIIYAILNLITELLQ